MSDQTARRVIFWFWVILIGLQLFVIAVNWHSTHK